MGITPFRNQCIQAGDVVQSIGRNANRAYGEEFVVRQYDKERDYVWYSENCRAKSSNFKLVRKNVDGIGFILGDKVIKSSMGISMEGRQDSSNFIEIMQIDSKAALLNNGEIQLLSNLMLVERAKM